MSAEIQISKWILNLIGRKSVLTLHRDYFHLRKPVERRVCEIAKHSHLPDYQRFYDKKREMVV